MPNQHTSEEAKKAKALYMQEWYKNNADRVKGYVSKTYYEARDALLLLLGNKCARCGFEDRRALQFDHINGDGYLDRRTNNDTKTSRGGYGAPLLRKWLADPDIKEKLQILCANCNWIKKSENNESGRGNPKGRPKKYTN